MRTQPLVWACLGCGCLSNPDPLEVTASGGSGSSGTLEGGTTTSTSAATTDATLEGTVGPVDSSGSGGSATSESESSTGVAPSCSNGVFEPPELCLLPDPEWTRDFGGDIIDFALATLDGDPGDGAVIAQVPEGEALLRAWWWDGQAQAGPTLSNVFPVAAIAHGVLAADFDGVAGDELLFVMSTHVYRARYSAATLIFDGPCMPSPGSLFVAGQLDGDAAREVAWSPSDNPYVLGATLSLEGDAFCTVTFDNEELAGKPGSIALGRYGPDMISDVAIAAGAEIFIGDTQNPFEFGPLMGVPAPANLGAIAIADLDGNDVPDDLVMATPAGIVTLRFDGGPPLQEGPIAAGTINDIAVGDLDGDGDDDVAIADVSAPEVLLLVNDGEGVLAPASGPTAPEASSAIAIGDLDGDGAADLVLGGVDGRLRAYLADP